MTVLSSDEINLDQLSSQYKKIILKCPFPNCNTKIIQYSSTKLKSQDIENAPKCIGIQNYPQIKEPKLSTSTSKFYQINDVWEFDNIGVSRPTEIQKEPILLKVDGEEEEEIQINIERLLICSECDRGSLGFAGIEYGKDNDHKNLNYFLSQNSVLYEYE
ncbi:hypothetical protein KGF54_002190 [Candida jiufengensis]|uniref:uncharacterized protein n=1 Tax=Candida jiufengensis TaxID=497108 RepID=UPI0022244694|nr:uncharacterized protein KGF54_002190 [Candida jiufengensis]KAI5954415.1 hypothetical protein KGF54_002190 [Candida jiufengensis]